MDIIILSVLVGALAVSCLLLVLVAAPMARDLKEEKLKHKALILQACVVCGLDRSLELSYELENGTAELFVSYPGGMKVSLLERVRTGSHKELDPLDGPDPWDLPDEEDEYER